MVMSGQGKIIVFGASGNVGQYLIEYLKTKIPAENIIAVDIVESEVLKYHQVPFIQIDINNPQDFEKLPHENIDAIVDLIGPMPAKMIGYHPREYVQTNILGTFNIGEYCVANKVKKMIYARSFCDILERAEKEDATLKVNTPPLFDYGNFHSVYSVSQISAVELLKCLHFFYKLPLIVFRLPTIYLWSKNDQYAVQGVMQKKMYRKLIDDAIEGKDLTIWGDPGRKKDMFYVKDLCRLLYMAIESDVDYGFYNAGTGIGTSLQQQIEGIIKVFDEKGTVTIKYDHTKPNSPQYIMDISEAEKDFGYSPEYSYLEMLRDMKKERARGLY